MNRLINILSGIKEEIDYSSVKELVTGGYLDSMDLLTLIGDIEEEFNIDIMANDIVPSNFDSVEAIWGMIQSKSNKCGEL